MPAPQSWMNQRPPVAKDVGPPGYEPGKPYQLHPRPGDPIHMPFDKDCAGCQDALVRGPKFVHFLNMGWNTFASYVSHIPDGIEVPRAAKPPGFFGRVWKAALNK